MKKLLWGFAALIALLSAAPAQAAPSYSPTFVVISTFTPGAALSLPFGFKNGSSAVDVKVQRIEVFNCSTGTYTGGLMQLWVYTSTTITNGTTVQVSTYTYDPNFTFPANVVGSNSPTTVVYESKQSRQLPVLRPLYVNNDETATSSLFDYWDASEGNDEPQALVFLRAANRGFVLEQRRLGTADITGGCVGVRVLFNAKAY